MERQFGNLEKGPFDVLIIGGGVYGAWTALDAGLRGLKVAVIDKGDWACGTSMASTKLIHGGLRYLENLRLDLVHSALEERKNLTAIAPHLVVPVRFFIPTYQDNRVGPMKLRTGLWLYDLMAGKGQPVSAHKRHGRDETLAQFGFLDQQGISGSFSYGDCQTDDFRLVLNVIEAASQTGVVAVNYTKAVSLLSKGKRVVGALVQDLVTGAIQEVAASVVVNAAGPWVPFVDQIHMLSSSVRYSKGVHLILPPLPTSDALLLMTRKDSRIFFVVPWYGKTLVGTTDSSYTGHPDQVGVESADIDYLINEANRHLTGVNWTRDSVIGGFAGLRTLQNEPGKTLSQVTREWSVIEPRPGLLVSIGGKFTTARPDAGKIVERCLELLQRPSGSVEPTTAYTLPSTPRGQYRQWRKTIMAKLLKSGLDKVSAGYLVARYGECVHTVIDIINEMPGMALRLLPDLPFVWAEVVYCLRTEMVVHLEDLLRRRIPLTILAKPNQDIAERAAGLAADILGWTAMDKNAEIKHLMMHWRLPSS